MGTARMGLGWVVLAAAAAVSYGAEPGEDGLRPGAKFESGARLRVVAAMPEPDSDPRVAPEECIAGFRKVVGTTPSSGPLEVPPSVTWYVEILDTGIDDERFAGLAKDLRAQGVPGISFFGCKRLTDNCMKALKGYAGLEYLDLRNCSIGETGVAHISKSAKLRFVDIDQRGYTGIYWSKDFKGLEAIDARGLRGLLGPELKPLSSLKKLHTVKISGGTPREPDLKLLKPLKNLRRLELPGMELVTDKSLKHFKGLKSIEHLDLRGSSITAEGTEQLAKLGTLQVLVLAGCQGIENGGFANLAKLPALRELDLTNTPIVDADLAELASVTTLERLVVPECWKLTDEGVARLAALTELRYLDLTGVQVTMKGASALKPLGKLRRLKLGKTGVTDADVKALGEALPDCWVSN